MKRFALLLACLMMTSLCGCSEAEPAPEATVSVETAAPEDVRWKEMNQKTYTEIGKILTDCGIGGVTEEEISRLESNYDLPDGITLNINRAAEFLTNLGYGKWNWDTMEWTPSHNGVYSFDVEVYPLIKIYTKFLLGIQALAPDEIQISDIVEDDSEADWDNGTGIIKVSFVFNGQSYNINARLNDDWFDMDFANAIGGIIKKDNKRLWFTTDGYQECIIFFRDENWAQHFSEQTGLELTPRL